MTIKQTYEELERERNELAAQVERLRSRAFAMLMNRTGLDEWYDLEKIYNETPPSALSALKAQWQAEAVDRCEKEVTASVNVLLKPHVAGVFAVIRQRAQEPSNANTNNPPA